MQYDYYLLEDGSCVILDEKNFIVVDRARDPTSAESKIWRLESITDRDYAEMAHDDYVKFISKYEVK